VGAYNDENNESAEGAVYFLFMQANSTVKSNVKISDGLNGFNPSGLSTNDYFGISLANIGDLDGDGIQDLAVGAGGDENLQSGAGAVYILFMNTNGSVKNHVKISNGLDGLASDALYFNDNFGYSVANLGDLNGDDVQDLAVGAREDSTGSYSVVGSVNILFMNTNGTVNSSVKIAPGTSGFNGTGFIGWERMGYSTANIGDLDQDGVQDIAVGAPFSEYLKNDEGAIFIMFLYRNGTVKNSVKISDGLNGFNPSGLSSTDYLGYSIANLGDLDGDGIQDLAVGAKNDEYLENGEGAFYILYLNQNGSVKSNIKVSDQLSGFIPTNLSASDSFGHSLSNIGDFNLDGVMDVAVGASFDENSESSEGAIYLLNLGTFLDTTSPSISYGSSTTAAGNKSQNYIQTQIIASDEYLDKVTVYLYNQSVIQNTTLTNASITLTYSNLPDGTYYINATANDTSGNIAYTSTQAITLDTTKPMIELLTPTNGLNTSLSTYNFTFNATDLNLDNCTL
jgi:hypothetical protein